MSGFPVFERAFILLIILCSVVSFTEQVTIMFKSGFSSGFAITNPFVDNAPAIVWESATLAEQPYASIQTLGDGRPSPLLDSFKS